MPGLRQPRTRRSSGSTARSPTRGRRPPPRGWRRGRGRRRRAGTAGCAACPTPRGGAGPRRATSRNSCAARRRASSRSFASVAPVRSASSASVSSGSSSSRRSATPPRRARRPRARSARSAALRASSRRDVVRFRRFGHRLVGRRRPPSCSTAGRQGEVVAPVGAPAFPGSPAPSCDGANTAPHSSVTISSAVRVAPSRSRTRPDSATSAASRPTRRGSPARLPRTPPATTPRRTVSIAPRTDEPMRTSGWVAGAAHELDDLVDPGRIEVVGARRPRRDDGCLVARASGSRRRAGTPGRTPRRRCGPCRSRRTGSSPPPAGSPATPRRRPRRGTWSSPSLITVMSTLSVSSGIRLISSTYSSDPSRSAGDQRAVDEHVGVVAVGQHPGRVEVADEPGRRQLGVALDELEARRRARRRRRAAASTCRCRAGPRAGRGGRRRARRRRARARAAARRRVDPRRSTSERGRRRSACRSVDDDAADVLAVAHVLVALVDLVERVAAW